jgi:molybdopterin-guanine dinucleotide biosynthesis protein A
VSREGRIAGVSAALLLGGASSRMGRDKAQLLLDGVPAATHLAEVLANLFEEVLLVGGDPPQGAQGRRVPDPEGPRSALRGLVGALTAASSQRVLVVATDLMTVSPDLLLALLAWPEAEAVVPRTGERAHPLCALYRREPVLDVAQRRLAAGQLALVDLLAELKVSYLEGSDLHAVDPGGLALFNANTPEEFEQLQQRLRDPKGA